MFRGGYTWGILKSVRSSVGTDITLAQPFSDCHVEAHLFTHKQGVLKVGKSADLGQTRLNGGIRPPVTWWTSQLVAPTTSRRNWQQAQNRREASW